MTDREYYEIKEYVEALSDSRLTDDFNDWRGTLLNVRQQMKVNHNAELINGVHRILTRMKIYALEIKNRDAAAGRRALNIVDSQKEKTKCS